MSETEGLEELRDGALIEELRRLRALASPGDIDSAPETGEYGRKATDEWLECPLCDGEGSVDGATYCNYDGHVVGVQFFGIGEQFRHNERYYRALVAAAPRLLDLAQAGERKPTDLAEAVAQFLHDEVDLPDKFVGYQWPLHDGDDGYRGGGAHVKLQPKDIVEHYRDAASRLVARFGSSLAQTGASGPQLSAEQYAYGALWSLLESDRTVNAARRILLERIGGLKSDGQRQAVAWAAATFDGPTDTEIAAMDFDGASRPLGDREEARAAIIQAMRDHYDARPPNFSGEWDDGAGAAADAILSLLSGSEAAGDGWRPIETAPKDKPILAYKDGWGPMEAHWVWGDDEDYEGWIATHADADVEPTHWMPLPPAPTPSGVQERLSLSPEEGG